MSKKYLVPSKTCPKCGEKMISEPINQIGDDIFIKYTCPRNNCVRKHYPLTKRVKINATKSKI